MQIVGINKRLVHRTHAHVLYLTCILATRIDPHNLFELRARRPVLSSQAVLSLLRLLPRHHNLVCRRHSNRCRWHNLHARTE